MLHHGASFDEVTNVMNDLKSQGVFLTDQCIFNLIIGFAERDEVESARYLAEQLPRNPGFFNVMRNNLPKIVFAR